MSKFLKFIVHFVVICTILCVVALAIPPFFGVNTVIIDDSEQVTNLPMGSVTYAIPVKTDEVAVGAPLLVQKGTKTYRYNVVSIDQKNGTGIVEDRVSGDGKEIPVAVKNYVPQIVITIGFLGYLLIATESMEGLIVLGLAVLFLIILYIIAELWKKEPQDDEYEEDEDTDPGYVKSAKELKREEKERAKLLKEEERQIRSEDKMSRKERKRKKKEEKRIIKTGGFVDEIYEEDFEQEEEERPVTVQTATSEAHELLKKEIAAATAEEQQMEPVPAAAAQAAPEAKQEVESVPEKMQEETPEPVEIRKRAIPAWSAAQLADKAKRDGDAPDIVRDEVTKVTLFDYSDIIGDELEE